MSLTSRQVLQGLRRYESRNVTLVEPGGSWPVVWARARGTAVWDLEGRRYLDLTAAFGVAAAGHANPAVVRAGREQMGRLLHAMGDVHPHEGKAKLARALSLLTFGRWGRGRRPMRGKVIFCNSGFEAVEAALKTARLATGRAGVVAFEGGYHGLGYGALNATHRPHFRDPFLDQLGGFGRFVPFPDAGALGATEQDGLVEQLEVRLQRLLNRGGIGAVLVEPVQGRGGIRVPPLSFLPMLRRVCSDHGALLILDEIYTGFGRTGRWFAAEHSGVVPDLICLGKALTGGFPLSACVGQADLMDAAWPAATGEAIHTSTYLGHPVGCAMALAQIQEIKRLGLVKRAAWLGQWLMGQMEGLAQAPTRSDGGQGGGAAVVLHPRGLGLMAGLELCRPDGRPAGDEVVRLMKRLLRLGYVILPEGADGEVLSLTPPLTVRERDLGRVLNAIAVVTGRRWRAQPSERRDP